MELILTLAMKFWQWTVLIAVVIIAAIINKFDKRAKTKLKFEYKELPHLQPLKISTKGKGFWKAIVMWLLSTRNWEITKDWHYTIDGKDYVIPAGFTFDGASIPKFLRTFFSPVGVLLVGGLVHDYAYKYKSLLLRDPKKNAAKSMEGRKKAWDSWDMTKPFRFEDNDLNNLTQKKADEIFRDININVNGFYTMNYLAYWSLRLGGFVAWNGHRKRNAKIPELK